MTFGPGEPIEIRMNGETIRVIPIQAAHTSGDSLVQFVNADVIMIGDFYRNYGYPFVDPTNGGTFAGCWMRSPSQWTWRTKRRVWCPVTARRSVVRIWRHIAT